MHLPPIYLRSAFTSTTNSVDASPLSIVPSESQHPRWGPAPIGTITFGILMMAITAFGIWHQIRRRRNLDGQRSHDQTAGGHSQLATTNELERSFHSVNPRQPGAGDEDTRESNIEIPVQGGVAARNGIS